jgi:hypothetical protein
MDMYALTFCYEGVDDNAPFATTIAVSESVQRLREEMAKCVENDTRINEEDEWDDDCNFIVNRYYGDVVTLQHKERINLYTSYRIHKVDIV